MICMIALWRIDQIGQKRIRGKGSEGFDGGFTEAVKNKVKRITAFNSIGHAEAIVFLVFFSGLLNMSSNGEG